MTPAGYSRTALLLRNELDRSLTDADAGGVLGASISVGLHGAVFASGVVTSARVTGEGQGLHLIVESGGRSCLACGFVFTPQEAVRDLVMLEGLAADQPGLYFFNVTVYEALPRRAMVCRDVATCIERRMARDKPGS